MKKHFAICLLIVLIAVVNTQAQDNKSLKPNEFSPKMFIGFSTGINNMVGLIGPQIEIVAVDKLIIGGGFGLSTWGFKYAFNLQYYPLGWYKFNIKTGFSSNSGLDSFETELELSSGSKEMVVLDLKPVSNLFFTAGRMWKMGKRNKFYLEGGYAVPLKTDNYYTLKSNVELSKTSKQVLQLLRPGGLIIAVGFNFAISAL